MLLDCCKALGCYVPPEPFDKKADQAEGGEALCAAVEKALRCISYGTLLKLALMTWHFDASSPVASQDLKFFLRRPYSSVIEIPRVRYQTIMRETTPLDCTFDFLLISTSGQMH